jgi:hypothetical protein
MKAHIEHILGWYAQKPVEVREKRTSRMAEHLREEQAKQDVSSAVNRYVYQSQR